MSQLSDYAEKLALDFLLNATSATRPTAWFISLHTGAPGETGANEIGASSAYTRQTATFGAASTGAGTATNSVALTFGPATTSNWGTVSGVGIWDATTAGNPLFVGILGTARVINIGDSLSFASAALVAALA